MQHVYRSFHRHIGRNLCSVRCAPRSLTSEHAEFLNLVRDHGEGSITLTRDVTNSTIAVLTLNNENKKNAISGRMMADLAEILDSLLLPGQITSTSTGKQFPIEGIVGLIIRGHGRIFCAGADLTLVKEKVNTSERGLMMSKFMTDALTRLRQSNLITVALLTGPAVGGGAELSTVADYRIMIQETREEQGVHGEKKEIEIDNNHICFIHASLGASPGWGGAYRLQSIVGRSNALLLLGTSMKVKPDQALGMGLVDQVVKVIQSLRTIDNMGQQQGNSSSSSSSSSASASSTTLSNDASPIMIAGMSAAINFLLPFTQQPYPNAVGDIKQVIASMEYSASPKEVMEMERRVFGQRWGSKDNQQALKSTKTR